MSNLIPIDPEHRAAFERLTAAWSEHRHLVVTAPVGTVPLLTMARHLHAQMPAPSRGDAWALGAAYHVTQKGRYPAGAPLRAPHHTCSLAGLMGGGHSSRLRPGECTLAHAGMLYLDEAARFSRAAVFGVVEAIKTGECRHIRYRDGGIRESVFPAGFRMLAYAQPCPCGYFGHPKRYCTDSTRAIERHVARLAPFRGCGDVGFVTLGQPTIGELSRGRSGR